MYVMVGNYNYMIKGQSGKFTIQKSLDAKDEWEGDTVQFGESSLVVYKNGNIVKELIGKVSILEDWKMMK